MSRPVIAVMTDFGHRDGFVGVMKGVILSLCRDVTLVDVANEIPPQDVRHAAWVLNQAFGPFPEATCFLCVVDPHVGNPEQKKLLIHFPAVRKAIVCPDNGLASWVLQKHPDASAYAIENPLLCRSTAEPSQTFHGRDIYAPVAAHYINALIQNRLQGFLSSLGEPLPLSRLVLLAAGEPCRTESGRVIGRIETADIYGNLITNIPNRWLAGFEKRHIVVNQKPYTAQKVSHYSAISDGCHESMQLGIVAGSHGCAELFVKNGSAAKALSVLPGAMVEIWP